MKEAWSAIDYSLSRDVLHRLVGGESVCLHQLLLDLLHGELKFPQNADGSKNSFLESCLLPFLESCLLPFLEGRDGELVKVEQFD